MNFGKPLSWVFLLALAADDARPESPFKHDRIEFKDVAPSRPLGIMARTKHPPFLAAQFLVSSSNEHDSKTPPRVSLFSCIDLPVQPTTLVAMLNDDEGKRRDQSDPKPLLDPSSKSTMTDAETALKKAVTACKEAAADPKIMQQFEIRP